MINVDRLLAQVMNGASAGEQQGGFLAPRAQDLPGRLRDLVSGNQGGHFGQASGGGLMGQAGALGTGALAGGLATALFGSKKMREVAGTALQVGAVAVIGGLAYKAYQNYRDGKPVVPQGVRDMLTGPTNTAPSSARDVETFIPSGQRADAVAHLMLKAMVAAAAADGHLDDAERQRIQTQLQASGLDDREQKFLSSVLSQPSSIAELAAEATTPALRAEVYAAARLAIEPDAPEERDWLNRLAVALNLEPGLKAHLDAIGGAHRSETN